MKYCNKAQNFDVHDDFNTTKAGVNYIEEFSHVFR